MDARMLAAVSGSLEGVNVAGLCRSLGISRQSFYKWRARFEAEGVNGLAERSRRPRYSPAQVPAAMEDLIVAKRKELDELGVDSGASTIQWHLWNDGARPPSEATIWRVLGRRGFVVRQPFKRPHSSLRRFAADWPNERWQLDHTDWRLAGGRVVQILNVVDDHSRLCVASVAAPTITSGVLWSVFSAAGGRWGLPSSCLSDNGLVFSGKLRGFEVDFEVRLRDAGIRAITAKPFHPQTCGKVERFQQTLKKWLRRRQRQLRTIEDLQEALDAFVDYYNRQRPHRGIGRRTPLACWQAIEPVGPGSARLPAPLRRSQVTVQKGVAAARPWQINVGVEHNGKAAMVVVDDTHASVFIGGNLVRALPLDRTRSYQSSGRLRGGPRRRP